MIRFLSKYPLASVLGAALVVRLLAVFWSEGFVHSDDHYDTIAVAWDWLQGGLWGEDGFLRWKQKLSPTIGRFPLYNLFLLAHMKLCQLLGINSLEVMMYLIRLSHALISLLPVWATFRVVQKVSRSDRWAVIGGLVVAFHFAFPFLGVRNLIEVVGGSLWIGAIWMFYRFSDDRQRRWLYAAALFTGLAWMIRFQLAFAVLPIPLVLWWETGRIRYAVHYSLGVGGMLLLAGLVDLWLLGQFAGSTVTNLTMNTSLGALYNTIPLLYIVLLLFLLVPPLSFWTPYLIGRPSFFKHHKILMISSLTFLAFHMLHANQQERFMFPILPAFVLIAVLSIWQYYSDRGEASLRNGWFRWPGWISLGLNLILLVALTFAYGHKGLIEPLIWLKANASPARVLFFQPEIRRWIPMEYAGTAISRRYIRDWPRFEAFKGICDQESPYDYCVVYPKRANDLPGYLDSLQTIVGPLELIHTVRPSYYDQALHLMNRKYNDNYAAFVYRIKTPQGESATTDNIPNKTTQSP